MKKKYYLLFYKIYKFWKSLSDDGFADWKAGLIIQTLQYFALFIIIGQLELISKNNFLPEGDPKIWAIPLGITMAIFNYYTFLHYRDWETYVDEFEKYSKLKKRLINFLIISFIFGIISLLVFTFYQYSLG